MLRLAKQATFDVKVEIPVPGAESIKIGVKFVGKTRSEYDAWNAVNKKQSFENLNEAMKEVVLDWTHVEVPFSHEALDQLFEIYPGSAIALYAKYGEEHNRAKAGN